MRIGHSSKKSILTAPSDKRNEPTKVSEFFQVQQQKKNIETVEKKKYSSGKISLKTCSVFLNKICEKNYFSPDS